VTAVKITEENVTRRNIKETDTVLIIIILYKYKYIIYMIYKSLHFEKLNIQATGENLWSS